MLQCGGTLLNASFLDSRPTRVLLHNGEHTAAIESLAERSLEGWPMRYQQRPKSVGHSIGIGAQIGVGATQQLQVSECFAAWLEGYPAEVTVVITRHPLEGQALPLLGWMRRHGQLDLILVLPDGSRTLIPASWTDLDPSTQPEIGTPATLGSVADLLHAGRVFAGVVHPDAARPDDGRISNLEGAHAQSAVGAGPRGDAGARTAALGVASGRAPARLRGGPGPSDRSVRRRSSGGPA